MLLFLWDIIINSICLHKTDLISLAAYSFVSHVALVVVISLIQMLGAYRNHRTNNSMQTFIHILTYKHEV
jgi:hypothetical protein